MRLNAGDEKEGSEMILVVALEMLQTREVFKVENSLRHEVECLLVTEEGGSDTCHGAGLDCFALEISADLQISVDMSRKDGNDFHDP